MPGRSNNCSSFEITARLPIQLQRERDTWSASTTGKISQPLCFAAQRPNCQDTSHRPVAGLMTARHDPFRLDGPQGRIYNADVNTRFKQRPLRLRSEEHTSELQSHHDLVCRLLL